jgi:hypothetical protein
MKQVVRVALVLGLVSGCNCGSHERLLKLPPVTKNTFTQVGSQQLDVLLVVDNSLAMQPFQQAAAQSMTDFINFLNGAHVDYQIAITSGDAVGYNSPVAGRGRFSAQGGTAIVSPQTPNAVSVLQQNLQLGNHGSNVQLPIYSAMAALGLIKAEHGAPPSGNEGFVRPGARLAIVFITDGDDNSASISPDGQTTIYGDFIEALRNLKGPGNLGLIFVEGILFDGPDSYPALHPERSPPQTCGTPNARQDQAVSFQLIDLLRNAPFNAFISSICGNSLSSLRTLAVQAAGFQTNFVLSQPADATSVVDCKNGESPFCVVVAGQTLPASEYRFDSKSNAIVFDQGFVPPAGASVEVSFVEVISNTLKTIADGGFYTDCKAPSDCPVGVTCNGGRCNLTCSNNADCQSGYLCGSGSTCVCESDSACPSGHYCGASGSCQPILPCQLNSDCADAGLICEARSQTCQPSGTCVLYPDAGYFDYFVAAYDCQSGSGCDGTKCQSGCIANFDCPSGQACNQNATCVAACQRTEDCCLGQVCGAGRCVAGQGVGGIPLCDLSSCVGSGTSCFGDGGACESDFDEQWGCVPYEPSAIRCAKGYEFQQVPLLLSLCTYGGSECTGGRVCSASLETPNGTCSCLSQSDCSGPTTCSDPLGIGENYCYGEATCAPVFQCIELFNSPGAVCSDSF